MWEHYSLDMANKKITCKVCKADLAYQGSTSVIHEHLKRKHVGHLNKTESFVFICQIMKATLCKVSERNKYCLIGRLITSIDNDQLIIKVVVSCSHTILFILQCTKSSLKSKSNGFRLCKLQKKIRSAKNWDHQLLINKTKDQKNVIGTSLGVIYKKCNLMY